MSLTLEQWKSDISVLNELRPHLCDTLKLANGQLILEKGDNQKSYGVTIPDPYAVGAHLVHCNTFIDHLWHAKAPGFADRKSACIN